MMVFEDELELNCDSSIETATTTERIDNVSPLTLQNSIYNIHHDDQVFASMLTTSDEKTALNLQNTEILSTYELLSWEKETNKISISSKIDYMFDPESYSKMKFGELTATTLFGIQLANYFRKIHPEYFKSSTSNTMKNFIDDNNQTKSVGDNKHVKELIVTCSAYKRMEVAAAPLAKVFLDVLNIFRSNQGLSLIKMTKIHREEVISHDFSNMTLEQREKTMKSNKLKFDNYDIMNKRMIIIDDCIMTGSHMKNIEESVMDLNLNVDMTFLYIIDGRKAMLSNKTEGE